MKTCYIIGAAELATGRLRPSEGDFCHRGGRGAASPGKAAHKAGPHARRL